MINTWLSDPIVNSLGVADVGLSDDDLALVNATLDRRDFSGGDFERLILPTTMKAFEVLGEGESRTYNKMTLEKGTPILPLRFKRGTGVGSNHLILVGEEIDKGRVIELSERLNKVNYQVADQFAQWIRETLLGKKPARLEPVAIDYTDMPEYFGSFA